jgi:hypothetical protein
VPKGKPIAVFFTYHDSQLRIPVIRAQWAPIIRAHSRRSNRRLTDTGTFAAAREYGRTDGIPIEVSQRPRDEQTGE